MFKVVDLRCMFCCESAPLGAIWAFRENFWDFRPMEFPQRNGKPCSELDEAICRRWYSKEREGAREQESEDGKRGAAMDTQDSSGGTAN